MKVTAVANLKGGVGKTLVVGNLGHAYAAQSVPTLLLDLDPQGTSPSISPTSRRTPRRASAWPTCLTVQATPRWLTR